MRSVGLAGLAVSIVLAAGCSGGNDDAAPSTTQEPPPTSPTTTESEVTTTTVAETSTTTTTIPETTTTTTVESTTSTTAVPTSTTLPEGVPPRVTFPDDPDKQAVVDAVYAFSELLFAAQADPTNEELRSAIDRVAGEPVRSRFIAFLDRTAEAGQAFVEVPGAPSYLEIFEAPVTVIDGSGLVDGCAVDRSVQVEVGGNPDGSDRLIDDTVVSAFHSYAVNRTDAGWLVVNFTISGEWENQSQCGDS